MVTYSYDGYACFVRCHIYICLRINARPETFHYACLYACLNACMHVCGHACMHVCVCMYIHINTYEYTCMQPASHGRREYLKPTTPRCKMMISQWMISIPGVGDLKPTHHPHTIHNLVIYMYI